MNGLFTSKLGCQVISLLVSLIQIRHSINILLLNLPQPLGRGTIGQRILSDLELRLAVWRQRAEATLVELLPVERSVVISTCAEGPGEHDTGRVETLPDLVEVAAAGDLLDENWGEALAAELLVDGEKVDFGAQDDLVSDAEVDGDGGDEGDELAGLGSSDTNMVFLLPAWRHHGPGSC